VIIGHYAAALLPRADDKKTPFGVFLLIANFPDFLWLALGLLKIEEPTPGSMWEATFQNLHVEMIYSHNAVPTILWALVLFIVVYILFRRVSSALWCSFLIILHFLCDLLAGYSHNILGPESPVIGLNLYHEAPQLALVIEALFGAGCVYWYVNRSKARGNPLRPKQVLYLYAIFVLGALIWLPTATIPLNVLFQLH